MPTGRSPISASQVTRWCCSRANHSASPVSKSRVGALRSEPSRKLDGNAVLVDRFGDVVRSFLHLQRGLSHGHPAPGPGQHLYVVAPVTDRQHVLALYPQLLGEVGKTGRLGAAFRRNVEPGRPADEVVGALQTDLFGELDELLLGGVRVPDDHTSDRLGDELLDALQRHLSGDLTVRKGPVDAVTDAALLDRARGARHVRG